MARKRALSTKNVHMMWNTCNKRKKRLMSVIVRLVSYDSAWITHFSRRCLDRSSTLPSFMKARSSKKRWWQFLSTRFKSRLCPSSRQVAYHEGFPKKRARCVKCSIRWCFGTNNPTGAISTKCRLHTAIKRCTASGAIATGLLWPMSTYSTSSSLASSILCVRPRVWVLPDHQTVKFLDVASSVVGAAWSGHSHRQFNISQT